MNKKLIVPVMVVVIGGASILSATGISAHGPGNGSGDGQDTMVQKLSQKFGLNESEVKAFFEEERAAHVAEHKAQMEAKLTQAVADGKITEAQKQAIITKLAEEFSQHQADKDSMKEMTPAERKAAHEQHRAELKAWAKEQGIEFGLLKSAGSKGMKGGAEVK